MPALSSMRPYKDEIATDILTGYIKTLKNEGVLPELEKDSIVIEQEINLQTGTIDYCLGGTFGNRSVVKRSINPDLLRGLKRGERAYNRHVRNIPPVGEVEELVKVKYNEYKLLGMTIEN
jgi:hypothetical protein